MKQTSALANLELLPKAVQQLIFSALIQELGTASSFEAYENEILEKFCQTFSIDNKEKLAALEKIKTLPHGQIPFSSVNYLAKLKNILAQQNYSDIESTIALITNILISPLDHGEIEERTAIIEQFEHPTTDVRIKAIRDILSSRLPDRLEILMRFFRTEKDLQVKYELRKAINEIETQHINEPTNNSEEEKNHLTKLRLALNSENLQKIKVACNYIVQYQLREMLPELEIIAKKIKEPFLKYTIVKLLKISPKHHAKIRDFLSDPEPRVVVTALEALNAIGDSSSLATIACFIKHQDSIIAKSATDIINKMSFDKTQELMAHLSRSRHSSYREAALHIRALLNIPLPPSHLPPPAMLPPATAMPLPVHSQKTHLPQPQPPQTYPPQPPPPHLQKPQPPHPQKTQLPTPHRPQQTSPQQTSPQHLSQNTPIPMSIQPNLPSAQTYPPTHHESEDRVPLFNTTEETIAWIKSKLARLRNEQEPKKVASGVMLISQIAGLGEVKMRLLKNFLVHHNDRVRANALEVLQGILPRQHRHIFVSALHDSHNRVIGNAIMGLLAYETTDQHEHDVANEFQEHINEALKRLITDNRENYNLTALYCLGILQQEKYLYILQLALQSEYQKVQERAMEILNSWSLISKEAKKILNSFRNQGLDEIDFSGNTNMLVIEAYKLLQEANTKLQQAKKTVSDKEIRELQTSLLGCEDDTAINNFVARFQSNQKGLLIDILEFFTHKKG